MKMSFEIEYVYNKGVYNYHIKKNILMKKILFVVIDNIIYNKPSNSRDIQTYYYFLKKNSSKVTKIVLDDNQQYFLKNLKLHSTISYCYINSSK